MKTGLRARSDTSWLTEWSRSIDYSLLICCAILCVIGLVLSLATGPAAASTIGQSDTFFYVYRQLSFVIIAIPCLLFITTLSPLGIRRLSLTVFIVAFIAMVAVLVYGETTKGANRWLNLGFISLQPSEFIKPALIVLTAWLLTQHAQLLPSFGTISALCLFITILGLLLLQPDIGQAALISAVFIVTMFVCGLPIRWSLSFIGGGIGLGIMLYALLPHVKQRIQTFINPSAYDTYQIDRAHEAIARGGLFGVGPGEGQIKIRLPDAHTDFTYAVAAEEYGLVICLGLICLYGWITLKGILMAGQQIDPFRRVAAVGLFTLFGLQAAINLAVNVNLIPPKGMTLPFISYGGSSLLGTALTLGMAFALIRIQPEIITKQTMRAGLHVK